MPITPAMTTGILSATHRRELAGPEPVASRELALGLHRLHDHLGSHHTQARHTHARLGSAVGSTRI